jgi:hypothetical protein
VSHLRRQAQHLIDSLARIGWSAGINDQGA